MSDIISQAQAVGFDIVIVIAGLGLFLYGINAIGDELKLIAGTRLKTIIDKYTTNRFKGFLVGIVVTALIQSSSATTTLVISLIRSNLMSFSQGMAVAMGSNIGTTITAIMIGFNLSAFAPYAILGGAFFELFATDKKNKSYARLLIFFGILFFGLDLMGDGLSVLTEMKIFTDFAILLSDNMIYGVILGTVMTIIIQSSSASIGIVQTLYGQGALTLGASLPILLGSNIGTTITAVLASIGGGKEAKKTSFFHTLVNVIGAVLFMIFMPLFTNVVSYFAAALGLNNMMEIAFAHFFFNFVTAIILFPFLNYLEVFINKIYAGTADEANELGIKTVFEKSIIPESPVLGLEVAHKGTLEMTEYCNKIFAYTKSFIKTKDEKAFEKADEYEQLVNQLNHKISNYLVEVSSYNLDDDNNQYLNDLIYSVKDLERIGDHLMNVNRHFISIFEQEEDLSEEAKIELNELMGLIEELLNDLVEVLKEPSRYLVDRIYGIEFQINKVEEEARNAFINRLKDRVPMGSMSMALYVDILSDFERVGDYTVSIVERAQNSL